MKRGYMTRGRRGGGGPSLMLDLDGGTTRPSGAFSGTTWLDHSIYGRHLVPVTQCSVVNNQFRVNGTAAQAFFDNQLLVANQLLDFSMSFWFQSSVEPTTTYGHTIWGSNGNQCSIFLQGWNNSRVRWRLSDTTNDWWDGGGNTTLVSFSSHIKSAAFRHLFFEGTNGDTVRMWLDGVDKGFVQGVGLCGLTIQGVGTSRTDIDEDYTLSRIRVWSRPLTTEERNAEYSGGY